jgi:lysophospholipase L1-like esterase
MQRYSFSFGSGFLGFALCAGSVVLACSNSDTNSSAAGGASSSAGAPAAGSAGQATSGSAGNGGAAGVPSSAGAGGTSVGASGANTAAGASAGGAAAGGNSAAGAGGASSSAGAGGAGTAGANGGIGGAQSSIPHTGAWKITPLGDSITGETCGPQLLSKELISNGRTNFVFVGSNLNNQSCNGASNVQTEGHGGYLVTDLVGSGQHASELPMWCNTNKSEVVLMQFGTNDVWNNIAPATILSAYSTVLTDLRAANAKVMLFVAQITPLNPAGCADCEARVETLNAQIPGWASSSSTTDSPVYVVDLHSLFNASAYLPNSTYTMDGVHPLEAGGQLIADRWYAALVSKGIP